MRIDSSMITMLGKSQQQIVTKSSERLTAWVGNQPDDQKQVTDNEESGFQKAFQMLKDAAEQEALQRLSRVENSEGEQLSISEEDANKIRLLNKILEALTGKKIRFYIPDKIILKQTVSLPQTLRPALQLQKTSGTSLKGWGFDYQKQDYYSEVETMSFQSEGKVTTSDGKTIQFDLNLNLSRSFVKESNVSIKGGDALADPLVINYGQPSTTLTTNKYSFDLDLDGKQDQISFAKSGSGFLVYDKNGDGIINDGSELFGPNTGDGFLELKKFDIDGNNWIDENDSIYDKLQIWTKDEKGNNELFAIGQKGIGAIYLGSVDTEFPYNNTNNDTMGLLRQTGIFLREDGTAGTIQHIDISL